LLSQQLEKKVLISFVKAFLQESGSGEYCSKNDSEKGKRGKQVRTQTRGLLHSPTLQLLASLIYLKIGHLFDQSVDKLSSILTHLTIDHDFNQSVNTLSQALTHLTIRYCFKQPVDKLPPTLIHLTTRAKFNQPVDNLSPKLMS
jgi:hypothetical protein